MNPYQEQLAHLKEMRNIMEKSSRFFSLSGISGVLVGIYALVAAAVAYYIIFIHNNAELYVSSYGRGESYSLAQSFFDENYINHVVGLNNVDLLLAAIGLGTLCISLLTVILLSKRKAEKSGEQLWNPTSKLLLWNLFLPLCIGGLFGLICMYKGWFALIGPITLIFYGMALINASKFTFGDIQVLGIIECLLGLASLFNIGYGLVFWAVGFGVLHIVYGIIIYYKYERVK